MRVGGSRPFGYPQRDAPAAQKPGLRLWSSPRVRECVWDVIMAGPLTPGLLNLYPELKSGLQQGSSYPAVAKPEGATAASCGLPLQQRPSTVQPLRPLGR